MYNVSEMVKEGEKLLNENPERDPIASELKQLEALVADEWHSAAIKWDLAFEALYFGVAIGARIGKAAAVKGLADD